MSGKFVSEWSAVAGGKLEEVDVAVGISALLAVKDEDELVRLVFPRSFQQLLTSCCAQRNETHAAKMTNHLMNHFSDVMATHIEENKKITHEQLGEQIETKLEDNKFWRRLVLGDGVSRQSYSGYTRC